MVRQLFAYPVSSVNCFIPAFVALALRSKRMNQIALLTHAISAAEFLSLAKIKILPLICYRIGL